MNVGQMKNERRKKVNTIAFSLRYYAKTDTYYIQIWGKQYAQLDKKVKRISSYLKHIQDEKHTEERLQLEKHRRQLLQKKWKSEYYVEIPSSNIPRNVQARPIYDLTGPIRQVEAEQYAMLLAHLTRREG